MVVHDAVVRVLVVEDHAELARDIAEGLRDRGIATDLAYDPAGVLHDANGGGLSQLPNCRAGSVASSVPVNAVAGCSTA